MYYFPTTLQESIQDLLSSDSRLYATKPPYEEFQQSLSRLPDYAKFTPVKKGKLPYQDEPLTAVEVLERHYNDSCFTGVGLLTGEASGGLVAVDHDGHSADEVLKELAGCPPEEALPPTLHWTSGRTGRYQMLYPVSKETREVISANGGLRVTGESTSTGCLEILYNSSHSVLPPSIHPKTGRYGWLSSPDTPVAPAPEWLEKYLRVQSRPSPLIWPEFYRRK